MPAVVKSFPFRQAVHLTAKFTKPDCTPVDPDTVILRVKSPSETTVYDLVDIIRDDVGEYHIDIDTPIDGTWFYRWEGSGLYEAVAEHSFTVRATEFGGSP